VQCTPLTILCQKASSAAGASDDEGKKKKKKKKKDKKEKREKKTGSLTFKKHEVMRLCVFLNLLFFPLSITLGTHPAAL
jgi:hypothetical protein